MDIDLYSPESVRDPWPAIAALRAAGPVLWNDGLRHWLVTTDKLCRRVLLDYERFSLTPITGPFFGPEAFIAIDDRERHDALRGVWSVAFQRATLERLEPLIAEIADAMLDKVIARFEAGEAVDAVDAFCRDLPAWVIAHMLGVPEEVRPKIVEWSDKMGAGGGVPNVDRENDPLWLASEAAKAELAAHLLDQIAWRRRNPGDDLISQIVHSDVGRTLSDDAIVQNTRQLLFAGNETTAKWLGHVVVTFARFPDARRAVREDPSLLASALEEVMRWEPVVQRIPRVVVADAEIEGVALKRGDQLMALVGAANRDPDRYADPDRFDIRRAPKAHLGFGYGMHSCLGVTLARLETRVATSRLLARLPDYALAGPPQYGTFGLRGPVKVPLAVR